MLKEYKNKRDERAAPVCFRSTPKLDKALDHISQASGMSKSAIIKHCLNIVLPKLKRDYRL